MTLVWKATAPIWFPDQLRGQLAYAEGDIVPDANVAAYGYDTAGLAVQVTAPTPVPGLAGLAHITVDAAAAEYMPYLLGSTTPRGPSNLTQLHGVLTGQGNGNKTTFAHLEVDSDNAAQQAGVNGATGSKVDGLNVIHTFGGTATYGGRHAIEGNLFLNNGATNPANPDRNYVAVQAQAVANNDDGGTNTTSGAKGALFGMGSYAFLTSTAVNYLNLTSSEFDVLTTPSASSRVKYLSGIQVCGAVGQRGTTYDCGIALSGFTDQGITHLGFHDGILIGDMNGVAALASDSNVLRVINHAALTNGLDFRGTTFSGSILKTAQVDLKESSLTMNDSAGTSQILLNAAGGGIEITKAASNAFIDFKNLTSEDFDLRLAESGGSLNIASNGTPALLISGTKVVGVRVTNYGAMTGTGNRATVYDTATVTLAQLAGRVKSLQDDLTTHGLIGP
jgi:hypothetical protein